MNVKQLMSSCVALGGATALLLPATTNAFVGGSDTLGITQRHFRVFNNFTDAEANDNVTPEPSFPGYTGATLAIWKACTEWGSVLHGGTGDGDPHQPGDLGSGGSYFDASFQGDATEVGDTNSNTFSEISGGSGGTLAFTETPITDGWRIRFYAFETWEDGPGTNIGSLNRDLQGGAVQLYGFAMGLDTTMVSGASMYATWSNNGVFRRSIEDADIAAVRSNYGVLQPSFKVLITGVSSSNGRLTITGTNFSLVNNEVWFTPDPATSNLVPVPVRVLGLQSNGTHLVVTVPTNAGSGDIAVKAGGSGVFKLSNGWPIDASSFPPAPGIGYCFGDGSLPTPCPCVPPNVVPNPSGAPDAGCANSFDLDGAKLTAAGGLSPDSLVFTCVIGGNSAAFGLILKGNGTDPNGVANGDGVRCVDGQLIRFGGHNAGTNGAPLGTWVYPNSVQTTAVSWATLQPGAQSAYYQLFYRNNAVSFCNPATTNMSNGWQVDWP